MKFLKEKLNTETSAPMLKAYYSLAEVYKILNISRKDSLKERILFLFDVSYKLPEDLLKIKRGIKKYNGRYYIKYTYVKRIEELIQLLKYKYKRAYNDYITAKYRYKSDLSRRLGEDNNKDYIYTIIKRGRRTKKMKSTSNKVTKKFKKKFLKYTRKAMLKKIYKEEQLC